jgi:hypothetical protein
LIIKGLEVAMSGFKTRGAVTEGRLIDVLYQLKEIFDLLQHDPVRRLTILENRRVGEWLK